MAEPSVFPAFIRAQLESGNAFAEFERQAGAAGTRAGQEVERHFKTATGEIERRLTQALTMPRNSVGAMDLGVPQMRAAVQAAEERAAALREVANAANAAAAKEGQLSGAMQTNVAAANAALVAAERDLQTKREQVVVYEQFQLQLDQTAAATARFAGGARAAATAAVATSTSLRQSSFGAQMLGQQFQDAGMQIALGTPILRVFAMQAGQTAFAIQQMGGAGSAFAGFIGGPWGSLILAGVSVLALFATRSQEAEAAQLNLADAADSLGRAQSLLGNFIDLTTGKQTGQNEVMREAIRLTAILAQLEALRAGREAGARLRAMRPDAFTDERGRPVSRAAAARGSVFGDGSDITGSGAQAGLTPNPGVAAFQQLVRNYNRNAGASVTEFRRSLEQMAASGQLHGVNINQAVQEAITIASNRNEIATMRDVRRVAEGGPVPSYLLRPRAGGRPNRGDRPTDQTEFGEDAGARIANITARFVDAPAQVEAVRRAMSELNDVASDLERRRPPNYETLVAQLGDARATVQDGLLQPYRDFLEQQDEGLAIQRLINAGRTEEAETLQSIIRLEDQVGTLDEAQRAAIARRVELRAEEARQAEIAQQRQAAYLRAIEETKGLLESTLTNLSGRGLNSFGDLASGLQSSFRQLTASTLIENMFGDTLREMEDVITGRGRVREANEHQAEASDTASAAIDRLGSAAARAADAMSPADGGGWSTAFPAANELAQAAEEAVAEMFGQASTAWSDAFQNVVVTGQRPKSAELANPLPSPRAFYEQLVRNLASNLFNDRTSKLIGTAVASGLQSVTLYNTFGKPLQDGLEKLLGLRRNPLSVLGVAGTAVGSLFFSPPRATSTISAGASGRLEIVGTTGTRRVQGQAVTAADSVLSNVERIAEMFGASVDAARGSVSIGVRDGSYRVDTSGRGITKTKKGAVDFGEDAEAAIRAAVLDLIRDGVIEGLKAGTQRLLQSGKDLDSAIGKALKFEGVFDDLKRHLDPVGAAIEEVDKRFASLKRVFEEAGASAEDYAALEELYGLERKEAIEQAGRALTSALKGLLDDLTVNNDAISLRDRLAAARAKYDPLAARVTAGDRSVDYDAFAEAARMVLEIQRQISGSTSPYFQALEEVTNLTRTALAGQENLISIATARAGPLDPAASSAPVVDAVGQLGSHLGEILSNQLGGQLRAINDNMGTLIRLTGTGGSIRYFNPAGFDDRLNF